MKGKGKARAVEEIRVDWRAAVQSSRDLEGSDSDVDTAAVQAAMSISKKWHEAAQRRQVSSVYHSQSGEAYESLASGSSPRVDEVDENDEALDAELRALLQDPNPSSSKKIRRHPRSRLSAQKKSRKKLPPIPEQVEDGQDAKAGRETGTPVPEIKVTVPEAESMAEEASTGVRPPTNVPTSIQVSVLFDDPRPLPPSPSSLDRQLPPP